jgi:hypothetical protein
MDLGSNFSAKLEPFLLMAKSVKGAAAAKLIQDATSAPGVFVFSELLELPNIQEVRSAQAYPSMGLSDAICGLIVGQQRRARQISVLVTAVCVQDISGL